jgi:CBS domain-containing membrane protein
MARRLFTNGWQLFAPVLAGANLRDRLLACLGALAGISLVGLLCSLLSSHPLVPLLVAPLGASAVLLFVVPASPLAQPWSIVGGNTVSALVGVAVTHLGLPVAAATGLAVAGAILAMSLLRCLHPPGGAAALTAVIGGPVVAATGWTFPFFPVALNSIALVMLGLAYHRLSGHSYPHRPVPIAGHEPAAVGAALHMDDLDRALNDLGETFDVSREDLELLFRQVEFHAAERLRGTRSAAAE